MNDSKRHDEMEQVLRELVTALRQIRSDRLCFPSAHWNLASRAIDRADGILGLAVLPPPHRLFGWSEVLVLNEDD